MQTIKSGTTITDGFTAAKMWTARIALLPLRVMLFSAWALSSGLWILGTIVSEKSRQSTKSTRPRGLKVQPSKGTSKESVTFSPNYFEGGMWIDGADNGSDADWFVGDGYYKWD